MMKRLSFVFLICLMLVGVTASVQAQPGIGTWSSPTDFAAGNWQEILLGGSEGAPGNEIEATSDGVYVFDGAILDNVIEDENQDETGCIKYIAEYKEGGTLELVNDPSTPWYNSFDPPEVSFTAVLGTATNQILKCDDGTMAFELTAAGVFEEYPGYGAVITARYDRGTPVVSDSPDPGGPQIMSAELSWVQITIMGPIAVDIKPGSCPNPINTKSKGVLPVAILGTQTFDVTRIDPASVELVGVNPLRWSVEDVSTPYEPFIGKEGPEACNEMGPDRIDDLTLKFSTQAIISALGPVNNGDVLTLELNALLVDGTPVTGEDVVIIRPNGSAGQQGQDPDIIPPCVKLKAAAKLSHSYMYCWMKEIQNQKGKYDRDACIGKAEKKFGHTWGADDEATMETIRALLYNGLRGIYEEIEGGMVSDDRNSAKLAREMLKAAEMRLGSLLKDECAIGSSAQNKADEKFQHRWEKGMTFQEKKRVEYNGPTMEDVRGMIDDLVGDVVEGIGL
jgi:hypothetical protein